MIDNSRKKNILIVDDNIINRSILKNILQDDYFTMEAEDGEEAIEAIETNLDTIDLVLLDLIMPNVDGIQVLECMHQKGWIDSIPVIMISSETANMYISKAYELGATDYIGRPYDNDIVKKRVKNTITLYTKQKALQEEITLQVENRQRDNQMMINILSSIVEYRNGESGLHVLNVRKICRILFNELFRITNKYDAYKKDLDSICTASALHDIGKIAIDESILNKPARLTDEEYAVMKTHASIGYLMIESISDQFKNVPLIEYIKYICLYHHEKWDGQGYPKGLKEDEIPIYAQVVSLADCYDALTSERCYKRAYSHEQSIKMLLNGECGKFNPLLLTCLKNVEKELQEVVQ